jgi:hypothetical protein
MKRIKWYLAGLMLVGLIGLTVDQKPNATYSAGVERLPMNGPEMPPPCPGGACTK